MKTIRHYGLVCGLLFFAIMMNLPAPEGLSPEGWHVLAVALWMVSWWLTEAVPIPVTALVPLVAFPLLGLGTLKDVSFDYANEAIFLTLGGFIIGAALQRWNLHLRFALKLVRRVGTEPHHVVGGFMIACAFISMWISNAAAALIMLPIAYSVASLILDEHEGSDTDKKNFGSALMLGLAFSASIGGMMTLVGTTTNVVFKGYMDDVFGLQIDFLDWMKIGVPVGLLMLALAWFLLCYMIFPCDSRNHKGIRDIIDRKLAEIGKFSHGEELVMFIFLLIVSLWIFQEPLHDVLPLLDLNDASIAILGAILFFVVPVDWKKGEMLLEWKDTKDLPWGILLLLGGGLAMAGMLNDHGVADWIGNGLSGMGHVPPLVLVFITIALVIFVTEFMSNMSTLTAFLPVITSVAIGCGENPLLLAIPATLAASCAFMLPISTPPNAIVFSTHLVTVPQMARAGMWLNIAAVFILVFAAYVLLPLVFGVELGVLPDWAKL
jgi:sodium-dependent dicarboxylate transporter 2/3/5